MAFFFVVVRRVGGTSAADVPTRSEIDELVGHQRIYNEVDRGKYPEVKTGSKDRTCRWCRKERDADFPSPFDIQRLYTLDIFCSR